VRLVRTAAMAAFAVTVLVAGFAGEGAARPLPTVGVGKTACSAWTAARQHRTPFVATLEQWVLGYLSGYNAFAPPPKDNFTDYDSTNLLGWVDNRCAAAPTSTVSSVLNDFVLQLAHSRTH
jgi:hypothetical protein